MKSADSPYRGQQIAFATMHKKERALLPFCQKILGADLVSCEKSLNTDLLGTFSGEIERKSGQREVLLEKCHLGIELSGFSLGLASEGSFGSHPAFFLPSSYEMLAFVDQKREIEVVESRLFLHTNFAHKKCKNNEDLKEFLKIAKFPSHGLIVRPNLWEDKSVVFKGIQDFQELLQAIRICAKRSQDEVAHIETDMRAHMNPTRLFTIQKLGIRLFRRLARLCPACGTPGWPKSSVLRGLPCSFCYSETDLAKAHIWSCVKCSYAEQKNIQDRVYADPRYCSFCNP